MILVLVLVYLSAINAQQLKYGSCPRVKVIQNFTVDKFLGKWYEIEKYYILGQTDKCVQKIITQKTDQVYGIEAKSISFFSNKYHSINGTMRLTGTPGEGKFKLSYPLDISSKIITYNVIGADDSDYCVVYACLNLLLSHMRYVWIYARSPIPMQETMNKAHQVLSDNHFDVSALTSVEQLLC